MGKGTQRQYLSAIAANIIAVSYGMSVGWVPPILPILQSNESPIGIVSQSDATWINSLLCIGAAVGSMVSGTLANKIGRKRCLQIIGLPQLMSWLFTMFGHEVIYLYFARFFAGFVGGCIYVLLPVYVTEISDTKNRGPLGLILILTINSGTVLSFCLAAYMDYMVAPACGACITMLFEGVFWFCCETPVFLQRTGNRRKAIKAIRYFRGISTPNDDLNRRKFEEELIAMIEQDNSEVRNDEDHSQSDGIKLRSLCVKSTRKALLIGLVLMVMTQFCGTYSVVNYSVVIFNMAGSTLSSNSSGIILAVIQLIAAYICGVVLVKYCKRKTMLIVSAVGVGCCMVTLGGYLILRDHSQGLDLSSWNWIPLLSLSGAVFLDNFGVVSLPYVVVCEILPYELRSVISGAFLIITWLISFCLLKYFPYAVDAFGLYSCMMFFGVCCFFEVFFVWFYMPETKGKSFMEIQRKLNE